MSADTDLAAARVRAEEAKLKLLNSTHILQERVAPSRLANDALVTAKQRGATALESASRAAQRRPGAFAAAAVGVVAFFARRRIARLFRRKREPDRITVKAAGRHALPRPTGDSK